MLFRSEPERITFNDFSVKFHGTNDDHSTCYKDGKWVCTCDFFNLLGRCADTMAMERVLDRMLPAEAKTKFEFDGIDH